MVRFSRQMWRGLAARVAIVGLVAQALVMAFHVPLPMRAHGEGVSALSQAIICSVHSDRGMPARFVQADADQPADPVAPGKIPICPLCLALAACPLATPMVLAALAVPRDLSVALTPPRVAVHVEGLRADSVRNRGPPVGVV